MRLTTYNQVTLTLILRQSRLFAKKTQLYLQSLSKLNFEEYIFINNRFSV